jgi:hypothetical protein
VDKQRVGVGLADLRQQLDLALGPRHAGDERPHPREVLVASEVEDGNAVRGRDPQRLAGPAGRAPGSRGGAVGRPADNERGGGVEISTEDLMAVAGVQAAGPAAEALPRRMVHGGHLHRLR